MRRELENCFRQNAAVGDDDDNFRTPGAQRFKKFGRSDFFRRDYRNTAGFGSLRTGEGEVFWPRPEGRSGWVTTPTTESA